jgi:uncharacterized protein (DUF433 family)
LLPFATLETATNRRGIVAIDLRVAFGRPIIQRLGVPTSIIAERHKTAQSGRFNRGPL